MKKQHPVKIFYYASKRLWLLLIPLLRGLVLVRVPFTVWLKGTWLDILVLLFILGTAILRWSVTSYELESDGIIYYSGIIARQKFKIPFLSLCSVYTERNFFLRPIGAVSIHMDTNAGLPGNSDLTLTVSKSDGQEMFKKISENNIKIKSVRSSYKPSKFNLMFFSFAFSSTLSGALFISTLILESGKIVGVSLEKQLLTTVDDISAKLSLGLPPLAIAISLFIISAWLISFIGNLLRYIKFKVYRHGNSINIANGFLTKRYYYINTEKINYADLRQNLLMKIFSVMSVHVSCSGYGKAKNELPVLVPITTKKQVITSLKLLLPTMPVIGGGVKAQKDNFFRYLWGPLLLIVLDIGGILVLTYFFEFWKQIIIFVGVMIGIASVWLLAAKLTALFTTGISYNNRNFTLRYSVFFAFHTILVPIDKIVKVTVTQSIFQKFTGTCDLKIYTCNEFLKCHWLMALNLNKTMKLIRNSGISESCYDIR